jgi:hypothetical protein
MKENLEPGQTTGKIENPAGVSPKPKPAETNMQPNSPKPKPAVASTQPVSPSASSPKPKPAVAATQPVSPSGASPKPKPCKTDKAFNAHNGGGQRLAPLAMGSLAGNGSRPASSSKEIASEVHQESGMRSKPVAKKRMENGFPLFSLKF